MNASARMASVGDNRPAILTVEQLKIDFAHIEKVIAELEAEAKNVPSVLEDDEDLTIATSVIGKLTKSAKRCEEVRLEQNKPYLDATNLLNDFFKRGYGVRLSAVKVKIETIATAYLRKKAQREQAVRDAAAAEAKRIADEAAAKAAAVVKAGEIKAATAAITESTALSTAADRAVSAAAAPVSSMATTKTEGGTAGLVDHWTFDDLDMGHVDLEALRPFLTQAAVEQAIRSFIKAGHRSINGARIFNDSKARVRA